MNLTALLAIACLLGGSGVDLPDHGPFQQLLARYVREDGVAYREWKDSAEDLQRLSAYVDGLEALDPEAMPRDDQLAYWIDLYNAATLELVLAHYPVASIRDIGGPEGSPWKRALLEVDGHALTLDQIENEIIRPRFGDARIHFALNCAAVSCPPLQAFAFDGEHLDAQLAAATQAALRDLRVFDASGCQAAGGTLRFSRLFEWYAQDFGDPVEFARQALNAQRGAERLPACAVAFMDYDWALNESLSSP